MHSHMILRTAGWNQDDVFVKNMTEPHVVCTGFGLSPWPSQLELSNMRADRIVAVAGFAYRSIDTAYPLATCTIDGHYFSVHKTSSQRGSPVSCCLYLSLWQDKSPAPPLSLRSISLSCSCSDKCSRSWQKHWPPYRQR